MFNGTCAQAIELQCSGMLLILFSGDHTIFQKTIAFIGKKKLLLFIILDESDATSGKKILGIEGVWKE